ncbi:MAG: RNA methyltransferase [Bacteroidetes bacterium]|nr:RNA methyltransferase [Bacteroidota bacterium]
MEKRKIPNEELGRKSVKEFRASEKTPAIIVLENVRSMNNVGSVFRTADAFLFEAVYLCGYTPVPPHREIHKTALGATETVTWKHFNTIAEAVESIREMNVKIFSVEQTEQSISPEKISLTNGERIALIFGNEVEGVSEEAIGLSDGVIEIPQAGMKHSLNIAVSAGIVCWEIFKKNLKK